MFSSRVLLNFSVDDGTGAIACSYWYTQEKKINFSKASQSPLFRDSGDSSDSDEAFEDYEEIYGVGDDVIARAESLMRDGRQVQLAGDQDNGDDVIEFFLRDGEPSEWGKPAPPFSFRYVRLGDLVTARGQLKMFSNTLEMHANTLTREPNPATELEHWQDCADLYFRLYAKEPAQIADFKPAETYESTLLGLLFDKGAASAVSFIVSADLCLAHPELSAKYPDVSKQHVESVLVALLGSGHLARAGNSSEMLTNSPGAMARDLYNAILFESQSPANRA